LRDLADDQARKLPKYPEVPVALLGRLAVDSKSRGFRVGEHILMDAMAKLLEQSATIAAYALVVDAKDAHAAAFYLRYDFIAFPTNPLRLFLPTATIARLFE
jgi:predicted GNAT family N-acyltransferase